MDRWLKPRIKTTEYLAQRCKSKEGRPRFRIFSGVAGFKSKSVDIHPYLMGVLLGDGTLSKNHIGLSNADEELRLKLLLCYKKTTNLKYSSKYDYRITKEKRSKYPNIYLDAIRKYRLAGKKSEEKFIPDDFKYNDIPAVGRQLSQG